MHDCSKGSTVYSYTIAEDGDYLWLAVSRSSNSSLYRWKRISHSLIHDLSFSATSTSNSGGFIYKSWLLKTQEVLVLFAWNSLHRKEIIMIFRSNKPPGRQWAHPPCKKDHKPYVSLHGDVAESAGVLKSTASRHLPKQTRDHKESCFFPNTVGLQ